jgi:hypothetical protein
MKMRLPINKNVSQFAGRFLFIAMRIFTQQFLKSKQV